MPSNKILYEAYYQDIVRRENEAEREIGRQVALDLIKVSDEYSDNVYWWTRRLRRLQRLRAKAVGRLF